MSIFYGTFTSVEKFFAGGKTESRKNNLINLGTVQKSYKLRSNAKTLN